MKPFGVASLPPKPFFESLEQRRMLYASIPSGYSAIQTVQIRPKAATYAAGVILQKGVTYFLRATGSAVNSSNVYRGDAAFLTGTKTPATTWGVSAIHGSTTGKPADWGAGQGDHIYGQRITPTANEPLSFSFANDATDTASTIAVTIYAPVPSVQVARIRTNRAAGVLSSAALKSTGIFIPVNNADWDRNGKADNLQSGAVKGDQFLLPITLPAIAGATAKDVYSIAAPPGTRVWLNADRTGHTAGVGLQATAAHTVYLEGTAEQANRAAVTLKMFVPFSGVKVQQDIPVTVFNLSGPATGTNARLFAYGSDSPKGNWSTAIGGTIDTNASKRVGDIAYASVAWSKISADDYVDFAVSKDYIWGLRVNVSSASA